MKYRTALIFVTGLAATLAAAWVGLPHALYKSTPQPVAFNHRLHKDKASMQCADCHAAQTDGSFSTPTLASCAACHADTIGTSAAEKTFVNEWVKPGRELPWQSYSRQPMNVRFSHAPHVNISKIACDSCHGSQGTSLKPAVYQQDRITGYSQQTMSMGACEDCHHRRGVETGCLACHE